MVPWNAARTKVQIKLSIQRLRTLQEKKLALAKKSRREIADLLLKGRVETCRLRVEGLIQDDIYMELLELLELYSEKLQARFNLLDASTGETPEESISDAVCAIVFAAPRTELKELNVLREMLMHKFGRQFSLTLLSTEPASDLVPERIRSKLSLYTPGAELVDAYLYEIARGYGVNWAPEPSSSGKAENVEGGDEGGAGPGDGQEKVENKEEVALEVPSGELGSNGKPRADAPPSTAVGQGKGSEGKGVDEAAAAIPPAPTSSGASTKKLTEEQELAARFERLKNLR